MSALTPDPQPPDTGPDPNPPSTATPSGPDRGRLRGSFPASEPTVCAGAAQGRRGASAARTVFKGNDGMPADPEPEAGKRVFAEWLGQLTRRLSESERVDPCDAFDALVDLEDCTPYPIPENVLVAAAVRLLQMRETDDPEPASVLRQVRAEFGK